MLNSPLLMHRIVDIESKSIQVLSDTLNSSKKQHLINFRRYVLLPLLLSILLVVISPFNAYAAIDFNSVIDISGGLSSSSNVQTASSGNNVFAVWEDGNDVFFANSTDNGVTFDADGPFNISNSGFSSTDPYIVASGTFVYVVWEEDTATNPEISFLRSSNSGASFDSSGIINLSQSAASSVTPQVAVSTSCVCVVWKDGNDVFFANSTDNGVTFDADGPFDISINAGVSFLPQITTSGNSVYVAWRQFTGPNDINFLASQDNGNSFGSTIDLTPTSTVVGGTTPGIAASGNGVYVVWEDSSGNSGQPDIFFANSTDNGVTFDADGPFNISNDSDPSESPEISAGDAISIAWVNDPVSSDSEIFIKSTVDSDQNFGSVQSLTPSPSLSFVSPAIVSSSEKIFVSWGESSADSDVFFNSKENSTDSTYVNLLKESDFDFDKDDAFSVSFWIKTTDSGAVKPLVYKRNGFATVSGWGIHTSGTGQIVFSMSDAGTSEMRVFTGSAINNGNWHHVTVTYDGTNTRDGIEIYLDGTLTGVARIANTSLTNSALNDQSVTLGARSDGQNEFSGQMDNLRIYSKELGSTDVSNLFIESGSAPNDEIVEILFENNLDDTSSSGGNGGLGVGATIFTDGAPVTNKAFDFDGLAFASANNLSNDAALAQSSKLSVSGNTVYAAWVDGSNILFRSGTPSTVSISFDKTKYRQSDTISLTVSDPNSNSNAGVAETISVSAISLNDTSGISVTLTENTVNSGSFVGTFAVSNSTTSGTQLQVLVGDTLQVTHPNGGVGFSSIYPRTVEFDFAGYDIDSSNATINVIDQNSNLDTNAYETVSVLITTAADSTGFSLTLNETGVNTGIFGGSSGSDLLFMRENNQFSTSAVITMSQEDSDDNLDSNAIDTTTTTVVSTTDTTGITLTLSETGLDTNMFSGTLTLSTGISVAGSTIQVSEGDFVTATHKSQVTRGIITPNPIPSRGAIVSNTNDVVTASFLGAEDTATVSPGGGGGGGGGSIGRPGLVLDAVAGVGVVAGIFNSLTGGSSNANYPTITGDSLSAITISSESLDTEGGFGGILSGAASDEDTVNNSVKTGDDISFGFNLYENQGINNISHVSLYLNAEGESDLLDSETYITFERFGSGLTINDPTGIFEHANFEIVQVDAYNFILQYDMSFSEIIGESDFLLVVWDGDRNLSKNLFENAISVESASESDDTSDVIESELVEDSSEILEPTTLKHPLATTNDQKDIPAWIKTTSKWWTNNEIGDSEFIKGVEFLVDEKILEIDKTDQNGPTFTKEIPDWVKKSVGWWSDGLIDDAEFKNALEWILNEGVMNI